jgi:hypothetical protein
MGMDIITAAHRIEADLGQLATSLVDDHLREQVVAVQANWREIAHDISATVCGVTLKKQERKKGPGRPAGKTKKHSDPAGRLSHEDSLSATGDMTSGVTAQP